MYLLPCSMRRKKQGVGNQKPILTERRECNGISLFYSPATPYDPAVWSGRYISGLGRVPHNSGQHWC